MSSEKHNLITYNIIIIVVLATILLTAIGGFMLLQTMPSENAIKGVDKGINPLIQPESTQTSPTGKLVMTVGIILLTIGFVIIVLMWLGRPSWLHRNPS